MFDIDTKVRVKKHNIVGTIIDIIEGFPKVYIVESDKKGFLDIGYGGRYPLFNCTSDEIEFCSYDMQ